MRRLLEGELYRTCRAQAQVRPCFFVFDEVLGTCSETSLPVADNRIFPPAHSMSVSSWIYVEQFCSKWLHPVRLLTVTRQVGISLAWLRSCSEKAKFSLNISNCLLLAATHWRGERHKVFDAFFRTKGKKHLDLDERIWSSLSWHVPCTLEILCVFGCSVLIWSLVLLPLFLETSVYHH